MNDYSKLIEKYQREAYETKIKIAKQKAEFETFNAQINIIMNNTTAMVNNLVYQAFNPNLFK